MTRFGWIGAAALLLFFVGCGKPAMEPKPSGAATPPTVQKPASEEAAEGTPSFRLAWSEHPGWGVFGVAHATGLIDKAEGRVGPVEKRWGIDLVVLRTDYEGSLGQYANAMIDAVCATNIDAVAAAAGRDSVAVLPTSTSVGAAACLAVGVESIEDLKGVPTHGPDGSVSRYVFQRALEVAGADPTEYEFLDMAPADAALALQSGKPDVRSIMVSNPLVLQTLRKQPDAKRVFDSRDASEEVVGLVLVGKEALAREAGAAFAHAVIDCYYRVNARLADRGLRGPTLKMLGDEFAGLTVEDMEGVVQETRMYPNADAGVGLFEGEAFRAETTPAVVAFCVSQETLTEAPTVGFDEEGVQLSFDTTYMKAVAEAE